MRVGGVCVKDVGDRAKWRTKVRPNPNRRGIKAKGNDDGNNMSTGGYATITARLERRKRSARPSEFANARGHL